MLRLKNLPGAAVKAAAQAMKNKAIHAAVINVAIVLAAKFGLHMTATEVAGLAALLAGLAGAYLHRHVKPAG